MRYGETLTGAVERVARQELDLGVAAGRLLGYIEYPSHLARGLDWPVGIAFLAEPATAPAAEPLGMPPGGARWFSRLPDDMHDEQRAFLRPTA